MAYLRNKKALRENLLQKKVTDENEYEGGTFNLEALKIMDEDYDKLKKI